MAATPLLLRLVTTATLLTAAALPPVHPTHGSDTVPAGNTAVADSRPTERNGAFSSEGEVIMQLVSHHQEDLQVADLILRSSPVSPELENFRVQMLASRTTQLQEMEQWLTNHGLPLQPGSNHRVGTGPEAGADSADSLPEAGSDIARMLIDHRTDILESTEEASAELADPEAATLISTILGELEEETLTLGAFLGTISDTSLADRCPRH